MKKIFTSPVYENIFTTLISIFRKSISMISKLVRACLLLCVVSSSFCNTVALANVDIKVDTTISEDNVFLIFRHPRSISLNPSFLGTKGRVRSDTPVNMSISSSLVNSLCSGLSLSGDDQKTINFKLDSKYKFLGVIYGEKLVAFKLNNPDFIRPEQKDSQEVAKLEEAQELKSKEVEISKEKQQQSENKSTTVKVQYNESAKFTQLTFPFTSKNVGAAVFKRGSDVWVVFDNRRDFYFAEAGGVVDGWSQYPDNSNTVIKMHLSKNLEPQVEKQGNNWVLKLVPSSAKKKPKSPISAASKNSHLVTIAPVSGVKHIITVRDKDIGDVLTIIPTAKVGVGMNQDRKMLDYNILETAQGVAIALVSEDVKVLYNDKEEDIEIASRYTAQEEEGQKQASMQDMKSTLPILAQRISGNEFINIDIKLKSALVSAGDNSTKTKALIDLAQFYFANGMYHETVGALYQAQQLDNKQSNMLFPSMMYAVSLVMKGENLDARGIFIGLKSRYQNSPNIQEIELWDKYNEFVLGSRPEYIVGEQDTKLLSFYPDEMYWKLILGDLALAADKKSIKKLDTILSAVRKTEDLYVNNNLKYYRAQYYYLQNQNNLSEQLLEEVIAHPADGRDLLMSKLQLIKIQYESRKIDWITTVQELNQLRYVWRGDKLELKLLLSLALAYEQNGDVINSIKTYKYVVDAFGKQQDSSFFVTSQIVNLYHRIFLSREFDSLDDFTVIALFYEFKDFTPIGVEGDEAVLSIARRMINLDLLDMAEDILDHQIAYRLRGTERVITANHLALVFLMDQKPENALAILDSTDKDNKSFQEYEERKYLKVKALIDLKKYKEALAYLIDDNTDNAIALKSEAYFMAGRWSDYVSLMEPIMKQKMADGDIIKGDQSQDVLRLAISYSMLSRSSDLAYIAQHLVTENKDLKSVVEFLRDTNSTINPHNIDKSLNIDKMQRFIDSYKSMLFS